MVPISSSLKCTLNLILTVHEWVNVFLCIAQSERLEQIKVYTEISEGHLSDYHSKKLTQLREAFEHSKIKKMDISLTSISRAPALDEAMRTLMLTLLEGVATYLQNIEFKIAYYGFQIQDQLSPSLRQMFRWSKNEFVLKPLEMRQSLNQPRPADWPRPADQPRPTDQP